MGAAKLKTEYLPDYIKDTTSTRKTKVTRRIGDGRGLIPRLLVATEHAPLSWVIHPIGRDMPLYDQDTARHARARAAEISGDAPAWHALQMGVNGGLHVNTIMPTAAVPKRRDLPKGTFVQPVDDLVGLIHYLSGPADARTSPQKDPRTRIKTKPTPEQLAAALADYQDARRHAKAEGRNLPRMQWPTNLPRLKADPAPLPQAAD